MGDFDLRADPAAIQAVGKTVSGDAATLREEATKLMTLVENLKSVWQDEGNIIYVNDATEYIKVLQEIIDALDNHGIYLSRTGSKIGETVDKIASKMRQMANM